MVGGQWGDEGKGKLVDILAQKFDVIVRATGGANAGHTIYVGNQKFVFHLVPAGMLHPGKICVMGNGMVVHLPTLLEEIEILKKAGVKISGRLLLSDRAHLVFEYHKIIDQLQEEMKGSQKVGTTRRGIGPAYMDKTSRIGIRAGELKNFAAFVAHYRRNLASLKKMYEFSFNGDAELRAIKKISKMVLPLIADTSLYLANALSAKKSILLEGANGTLLDIDHGTFPYVTSSNASIGGIIAGSGIAPSRIVENIAIMKAYVTRVGSGPFPTELKDALGDKIREIGNEFGATTGRPRRCGWFDAVAAQYSMRVNGFSAINLTKVDVLSTLKKLKICTAYIYKGKKLAEFPADLSVLEQCRPHYIEMSGWQEDISSAKKFHQLPKNCMAYIKKLEKLIGCPIRYIGTGKRREEMIFRK
ncbi:adenylosuccinate synthase [Candidatus Peregrinibacteria bacterium]|nr:adenylosuccinate synthase [Candidatus Peregrinibacteria bacterium]